MRVIVYNRVFDGKIQPHVLGSYADSCDLGELHALVDKLNANPGMHMSYPSQDDPTASNYRVVSLGLENMAATPDKLREQLNHPLFKNEVLASEVS